MKLNLTLFDGAAGGAAGGVAGAAGTTAAAGAGAESTGVKGNPQDAAGGAGTGAEGVADQETSVEDTRTPEERKQDFMNLISGEYSDLYHEQVEGIIDRRLRGHREQKEQLDKAMGLLNYLGSRYGITDGDIDHIQKAVEEDNAYWEDAAAREGLSTEQYKRMKKLEAENSAFLKAKENAERLQQRDQMYQKWNTEATELSKIYKGFDLRTEVSNPDFVRLLGAGISMRTAYETLHHDEILSGAMAHTAKTVAKKQIDAIKAGQARPAEGAAGSGTAYQGTTSVEKMTGAQILELGRRSLAGETIDLSSIR